MKLHRIIVDMILILVSCVFTGFSLMIGAAPTGGTVQYGSATINYGTNTTINQSTQKGIINWQSFGIGQNESVQFVQPNASAITLNRVMGGDISNILGVLTATGHILLINPSGIVFGPNARIDVAGLIASTADITDADFLNGNYLFTQGSNNVASIINQGIIRARDNGMIALIAPSVQNSGIIKANLGTVILGSAPSGSAFTIDFYGDGLLQFVLPPTATASISNAIVQSGKIKANGGTVLLTANTASNVVNNTINMSGIIEANSVANRNGQIFLMGGSGGVVNISGTMKARGRKSGETGGAIEVVGNNIALLSGALLDVSGQAGGGTVLIGGGPHGGGGLQTAQTTYIDPAATILANALAQGNGGTIVAWADEATGFYGTAEAEGGPEGGNGGYVETSGGWLGVDGSNINTSAPMGQAGLWELDPITVNIIAGSASTGGSWTGSYIWGNTTGPTSNIGATDIANKLQTGSITISAGQGSSGTGAININSPISQAGAVGGATLTLTPDTGQSIYANVANPITGDFNVNLNGPFVVNSSSVTINMGTGGAATVTFGGPISGSSANSLSITTLTGGVTFSSGTGSTPQLANLTLTSSGGAATLGSSGLGTVYIDTYGSQSYYRTILASNAYLSSSSGGNISFNTVNDTSTGAHSLNIGTTGTVTFGQAVGGTYAPASLTITASNIYDNEFTGINTVGNQSYSGILNLYGGGTHTLDSYGGNITLNGGAQNYSGVASLVVSAAGTATIGNNVGSSASALSSLSVIAPGGIYLNNASVYTNGSGTTQTYNNAVTFGAGTEVLSATGTGSSINFVAGTTTLSSGANVTLSGNSFSLQSIQGAAAGNGILTLNSVSPITLSTNIGSPSLPISGLTVSPSITFAGGNVYTSGGGQSYNNSIALSSNTILSESSNTGQMIFVGTINDAVSGAAGLQIINDYFGQFDTAVGGTTPLQYLTVSGTGTFFIRNISTTGSQTYNVPIGLWSGGGGGATITLSGASTTGTSIQLNQGAGNWSSYAYGLSIATGSSGSATLGGSFGIGSSPLSGVTISGPAGINLNNASVYTSGSGTTQAYSGAVTFGSGTEVLSAAGGSVSFSSSPITLGTSSNVTLAGSGITLRNIVGSPAGSGNLTLNVVPSGGLNTNIGASSLPIGSLVVTPAITLSTANVYTSGNQTYSNAVTFSGTDTLQTTGGTINFGSNNIYLNNGSITYLIGGSVAGNAVLASSGMGQGTLNIGSTGSPTAANFAYMGSGTNGPLSVFLWDPNSILTIGYWGIYTGSSQSYIGTLSMSSSSSGLHAANSGSSITVGAVSDSGGGGTFSVMFDNGGTVSFNGPIGSSTSSLGSLAVTGSNSISFNNGANVYTSGSGTTQTYSGAVTFNSGTEILSAGAGGISFSSSPTLGQSSNVTLIGNSVGSSTTAITAAGAGYGNLTLGAGSAGTYLFSNLGTGSSPLGSVLLNLNATLNFGSSATGGGAYTSGAQTYSGTVGLIGTTTSYGLSSSGGSITLGTVSAAAGKTLNVTALAGTVSLIGGTIGTGSSLTAFNVTGIGANAITISSENVYTSAAAGQSYSGAVTFGSGTEILSAVGGSIYFGSSPITLNSGSSPTFSGNSITLQNIVGSSSSGTGSLILNVPLTLTTQIGSASLPIASLTVSQPITFSGGSAYTTGAQAYSGAVTFGSGTEVLSAAGGSIYFGSSPITLGTSSVVTFAGSNISLQPIQGAAASGTGTLNLNVVPSGGITTNIGSAGLPLSSVTISPSSAFTFSGSSVYTSGSGTTQTYNNAISFTGTDTLSAIGSSINFGSNVLTLNNGSTVNLIGNAIGGAIGGSAGGYGTLGLGTGTYSFSYIGNGSGNALSAVTLASGGTLNLGSAGSVYTTGNQAYTGATLGLSSGTTTLSASGTNSSISLGAVNGAGDSLAIGATGTNGTVTFSGAVGSSGSQLSSLTVTASGSSGITFNSGSVYTSGNQTYNNAVTFVSGSSDTLSTTGGTIGFSGAVTFNSGTEIVSAGTGSITFSANPTLGQSSNVTLIGNSVGSSATAISAAGAGYGNLILGGGTLLFSSIGSSSGNAIGSVILNTGATLNFAGSGAGGGAYTSGAQTYSGTIGLTGSTSSFGLSSSGGSITLGTVSAAAGKTLNVTAPSGTVSLIGGTIGTGSSLAALSVSGSGVNAITFSSENVYTSGSAGQSYNGAVSFTGTDTLSAATGSSINFGSNGLTLSNGSTVNLLGNAIGGAIGGSAGGYGTLSLGTGTYSFSYIGNGSGNALSAVTLASGGTLNLGSAGSVYTTGNQAYTGATLGLSSGTTTLSASGTNSSISLGTVNGAGSGLVVGATGTNGTVTFNGVVGGSGSNALSSLTVSVNVFGKITLGGGSVYTSGLQSYQGWVTLGANTTLTSTLSSAGISFNNNIDAPGGPFSLTINDPSSPVYFNGSAIGTNNVLSSLAVTASTIYFEGGGGDVASTTGSQTYTGPIELFETAVFTATSGTGNVTFNNNIIAEDSSFNLTVNNTGTGQVIFGGTVGQFNRLSVTAPGGIYLNGGNGGGCTICTNAGQTYTGPVILSADTTLLNNSGVASFSSTIGGSGYNLIFNGLFGGTVFDGLIGTSSMPLASLTVGAANFNNGGAYTTGNQTYNNVVTLSGSSDVLSSLLGAISFSSGVTFGSSGTAAIIIGSSVGSTSTAITTSYSGNSLTLGGGTLTFSSIGGSAASNALGSVLLNSGSTLNLGSSGSGGSVYTSGSQMYTGATLGLSSGTTTLRATGASSNISLGTVSGAGDSLVVGATGASGTVAFSGSVGGSSTALSSLTVTAPSGITFGGGSIYVYTSGNQQYNNAVNLGAPTTLNSSGGNVGFSSTINGGNALTVKSSGNITFGGAIGGSTPLASLSVLPSSDDIILSGSVTTTGAQLYGNPVLLGANITLTTQNGGSNVEFDSTVNSTASSYYGLTVNSAGSAIFNGVVGVGSTSTSQLSYLSATATNGINLNGASVYTSGSSGQTYASAVTFGSGTESLSAVSGGGISFSSGVTTLGQSSNVTLSGSNITLQNIQGASSSGTGSLTLNVVPSPALTTSIGSSSLPIGSLVVTPAITFSSTSVYTSGAQTYSSAVNLNGASDVLSAGDVISFGSNAVTLGTSSAATLTGSSITGTAVNGANTSSLTLGGPASFASIGGSSVPLAALLANNALTLGSGGGVYTTIAGSGTGAQTYNGALNLSGGTTTLSAGGGSIALSGVNGAGDTLSIATTGAGTVAFNGLVGSSGSALGSLSVVASSGTTFNNASVYTSGSSGSTTQTYTGAVTFASGAGSSDTISELGAGDIVFNNAVNLNANTNTISDVGGNIVFNDVINLGSATSTLLSSGSSSGSITGGVVNGYSNSNLTLNTTSDLFTSIGSSSSPIGVLTLQAPGGAQIALNLGTVYSGSQIYNSSLLLSGSNILNTTGSLIFNNAIDTNDSSSTLTINDSSGTVTFNGDIGDSPLGALSVTASLINIGGITILTTGPQTYTGAVMLTGSGSSSTTTMQTSLGTGNVVFSGTSSTVGSSVNGISSLVISASGGGYATFGGVVGGGSNALSSLGVTASQINVGGGAVTTTGTQAYTGPVNLPSSSTTTLTGSSIGGTGATVAGANTSSLVLAGPALFASIGGSSTPLASLLANNALTLGSGGGVYTTIAGSGTGAQTYNGALNLGSGTTTLSAGGGNIALSGVNGAGDTLSIATTGAGMVAFNSSVGSTSSALGSLSVAAPGGITFNNAGIYTASTQTFNNPITLLGGTTTLDSTSGAGGDIVFNSTIDGGYGLVINSGANATFGGVVGGSNALSSLGVTASQINLNGSAVTTSGAQTYTGAVNLPSSVNTTLTGSSITGSAVNGDTTSALTLGGPASFVSIGGSSTQISSLTVNASSPFTLTGGGGVYTTGAQTYSSAVNLNGASDILSAGDVISFGSNTLTLGTSTAVTLTGSSITGSAVNGDITSSLTLGGPASFASIGGSSTQIASLVVNASSPFTLTGGGGVYTTGAQTYSSAVNLNGASDILSAGDVISFGSNAVTLGTSTAATLAGSSVTGSAVNGDITSTLTLGGPVSFASIGGSSTQISSLTVNAGSPFTLTGGGGVYTTGAQTYSSAVNLNGASDVLSAGDVISFGSNAVTLGTSTAATLTGSSITGTAVNGANTSSLTLGGPASFASIGGSSTQISSLTVNASSPFTLTGGGGVYTTGAQTYSSAVNLSGVSDVLSAGDVISFGSNVLTLGTSTAVTLTGSSITGSEVNGASTSALTLGGPASFASIGGSSTQISSLTVNASSPFTLTGGGGVYTTGAQTYSSAVNLNGASDVLSAGGAIGFGSNTLTLGISTAATLTGSSITGSAVNGDTTSALTLGGPASFVSIGGSSTQISSLTVNASSPFTLTGGGGVYTTGAQTYSSAVNLNGASNMLSAGDVISFGSNILTLGTSTAATLVGSSITGNTVNGDITSTLTLGGPASFASIGGSSTQISSLTVNASSPFTLTGGGGVYTTGAQTYSSAVNLNGASDVLSAGDVISFGSNALTLGTSTAATLTGSSITGTAVNGDITSNLTLGGPASFASIGGSSVPLAALLANDALTLGSGGGVYTTIAGSGTGAQTYNGALNLSGGTTTLSAGGGSIALSGVNGAGDTLSIATTGAGTVAFNGSVGSSGSALGSLSVVAPSGTTFNNASVYTSGSSGSTTQTYTGAVTFASGAGSSDTISELGAGDIVFNNAVNLNANTNTISDVGGNIVFNDVINLGSATSTLLSSGSSSGSITGGVVNGYSNSNLTLNTTSDLFTSIGSSSSPIGALTLEAPGGAPIALNLGTVYSGSQIYNSSLLLSGSNILNTTGSLIFNHAIDTNDSSSTLTINDNSGTVTFNGDIGDAPLGSLSVTASLINIGGITILTTGPQTYTGAVMLTGSSGSNITTMQTSLGTGNVVFSGTSSTVGSSVNGISGLVIGASGGGYATFGGVVGGGSNALSSLGVTASPIYINGGAVTTTGAQTYTGAVNLPSSTTTTLTGSSIGGTGATVAGANTSSLVLAGPASFASIGGSSTPLASLLANNALTLGSGGGVYTTIAGSGTGAQTYNGALNLGSGTATLSAGGGNIALGGVNGAGDTLSIATTGAGTVAFNGSVGSYGASSALGSLSVTAPGGIILNGSGSAVSIYTAGTQSYTGPVTLSGSSDTISVVVAGNILFNNAVNFNATTNTINDVGGNIIFNSVVNFGSGTNTANITGGAVGTTVNAASGGGGILNLNVTGGLVSIFTNLGTSGGTSNALTSVNVGALILNSGGGVYTTAGQTYGGLVTLNGEGATDVLSSTGGPIVFNSGVFFGSSTTIANITGSSITGPLVTAASGGGGILNLTGPATFGSLGAIGANNALTSVNAGALTLTGGIGVYTTGEQSYSGVVTLNGAINVLNAGGAINLNNALILGSSPAANLSGSSVTLSNVNGGTSNALSVTATGSGASAVSLNGSVGSSGSPLGAVTMSAANGGTTLNNASVYTSVVSGSTAQNYVGSVTLSGSSDTISELGAGNINFNNVVNLNAMTNTINDVGGNVAFSNVVNFGLGTNTANITGKSITGTAFNAASGGGGILNLTGPASFASIGSSGEPIDSLLVNASSPLIVTGSGVYTLNDQTYNSGVTLNGVTSSLLAGGAINLGSNALTLGGGTSATLAGSSITGSAVNGATTSALTLGGPASFASIGSSSTRIASLVVNASSSLIVTGSGVYTLNDQTYNSGVTLNGVTSSLLAGGAINFGSNDLTLGGGTSATLTGSSITGGAVNGDITSSLTLGGPASFTSIGGSSAPIGSLLANADLTLGSDGGVYTTIGGSASGAQTYNGALNLGSGTTTLSADGGNIILGNVNGASDTLSIGTTGAGTVAFNGLVGSSSSALDLLSVAAPGGITFNNAGIYTASTQTYNNPITLAGGITTLDSTSGAGGDVVFNSTIDGGYGLVINSGANATFGGIVGGSNALSSLGITASQINLNGGAVTTTGAQTYNSPVVLGADNVLSGSDIGFSSTIDSDSSITARALTLSSSGTATFGGAVGGSNALSSLGVTASQINLNGGAVTTTGAQTYTGPVVLGADNVLSGSDIGFSSTIDSDSSITARALTLSSSGNATFGGAVGGSNVLSSLGVTASQINLNGGAITTTGAQTYNSPVVLGADNVLSGSDIGFSSTIDSDSSITARALTLSSSGTATFGGAVGGSNALSSLDVTASQINLNGGAVMTTGAQTYTGPVVLGADNTLSGGDISFTGAVDSDLTARALTLSSSGTATFGGAVGGSSALSSLGVTASQINLNGGAVTTTGAQTYTGPVVLGADNTLSGGDISFTGAVDSDLTARALTLFSSGNATFGGVVGGSNALSSLGVTASQINLNGGAVTTTGTQSYSGPVLLGAGTTLTSSTSDVLFNGTSSTIDGSQALTISALSGNATFGGVVGGGSNALSLLGVTASQINLNGGAVTTTGAQTYTGLVNLPSSATTTLTGSSITGSAANGDTTSALTLGGPASFASIGGSSVPISSLLVGASSPFTLTGGGGVYTTGAQTYSSAVNLNGANDVLSAGGAIGFGSNALTLGTSTAATLAGSSISGSAVNGVTTSSLTLTSNSDTFTSIGSSSSPLGSLAVGAVSGAVSFNVGSVYVVGSQAYNDPLLLSTNTVIGTTAGTGNIVFNSSIDTNNGSSLTVNDGSGSVTFGGDIGDAPLASLSVTAQQINIGGITISTTGPQTYTGAVMLTGSSGSNITTMNTSLGTGNIVFSGTSSTVGSSVNGISGLVIGASGGGYATFGGVVGGGSNALSSLGVTASPIYINGGAVITTGAQTYTGPVTLPSSATTTLTGSSITGSTVNGDTTSSLTLGGPASFASIGGSSAPIGSLLANTDLTLGSGGGVYTTIAGSGSGAQTYNGALNLSSGTTTLSAGGGNIALSNVNGAGNTLSIATTGAGTVAFNGLVGSSSGALGSLSIAAPGGITFNNAGIYTASTQTYSNPITLAGGTTTLDSTSGAGGDVVFNSTIDGGYSLVINSGANVTFGGVVGGSNALSSLGVTASQINLNGDAVTTTGDQTYTGPVVLGVDNTLTGNNISFTGTVDSNSSTAQALTISASGAATFGDIVGGNNALTSLGVTASQINLNGGSVTTTGAQTYTGPVVLGADNTLSGGDISFTGTVDSDLTARVLTLSADGIVTFGGAVGGSNALSSFNVTASQINLNGGAVTTTGAQSYDGPVVLGADNTLRGSEITFGNPIDSDSSITPRALTLSATTNNVVFWDVVGGNNALSSLDVTGLQIYLIGGAVTTTGAQTYRSPVVVGADSALSGGAISFAGTVDSYGANALTLSASGAVTFSGAVGGSYALGSLDVTASQINLNGASVYTSGGSGQSYAGAVTFGSGTESLSDTSGSGISFSSGVTTLNSGSNVTFSGSSLTLQNIYGASSSGTGSLTLNVVPSALTTAIGSSSLPIGSLTVTPAITFSNGSVYTSGTQTYNGQVALGTDTSLTTIGGGDIDFLGIVSSATPNNLTLNTSGSGNISFNGQVGSSANPIGALEIVNANNVTVNNVGVYANSFSQDAGNGITNFGSDSLHVLGGWSTTVITNIVNGHVILSAAPLDLGVNYANLFGSIAGSSGIGNIVLLHSIQPGTQYFNGVDISGISPVPPTPPVPPPPVVPPEANVSTVVNNIGSNSSSTSSGNIVNITINSYTSPSLESLSEQAAAADAVLQQSPSVECEESSD